MTSKASFVDVTGRRQEIDLDVTMYKAASENGMSLTQYINANYPTAHPTATTFEQLCASSGLFLHSDRELGVNPPNMKQVLEGGVRLNVGTITRPDGSGTTTPSGRLLFPEVVLNVIYSGFTAANSRFMQAYESAIAMTTSVNSPKVDQPIINATAPEAYSSMPISQLALPAKMLSITVSDKVLKIPTHSIGLEISDQALEAATLDLVGIAMSRQAAAESIRRAQQDIKNMVQGDSDIGESALSTQLVTAYDSSIATAGTMTQKAWVKWLWNKQAYDINVTHIICDIDTAMAIQNRTNKPTIQTDDPNSPRIDALLNVDNLGLNGVRIIPVETSLLGANVCIGLDSRYAIRRLVNVAASYSAIESYVMRRSQAFRVDFGSITTKLYSDAWQGLVLATS